MNIQIKDYLIPGIAFAFFVYFMVFVIFYAMKISSPNVNFYQADDRTKQTPETDAEKQLRQISEEIRKK